MSILKKSKKDDEANLIPSYNGGKEFTLSRLEDRCSSKTQCLYYSSLLLASLTHESLRGMYDKIHIPTMYNLIQWTRQDAEHVPQPALLPDKHLKLPTSIDVV